MTSSWCETRMEQLLNPTPPMRTEMGKSPYEVGYTEDELNMRRKAEILKYKKSQQNGTTRREQYSSTMVLAHSTINHYSAYLASSTEECSGTTASNISLPSYYSGVPGKPILLYEPTGVPLYHSRNTRTMLFN